MVRYDSLNRVVAVVDPLGQVTSYAYDEVSNLVSFTDARESETTYLYDDLNRLLRITYPDANYEEFSYTPAGDLASYTNARGQERVFAYDLAHRLESIEFQTDMSTLEFSYDEVGNLIAQTERNGDQVFYSYDSLNRLIDVLRVPGVGSDTPGWSHAHQYDENGNRVAFSTDGPAYGSAVYGTSLYGITEATGARYDDGTYDDGTYASHPLGWSVPSPGYDEMNRLPVFADPRGREVSFSFDADGRRTEINYPNGVDLRTGARYDIVGRLLSLTTTDAATELLKLEYGYSPASERIAMRHNDDTWEYRLDNLGRLVEEAVNRMVDRTADQFAQGEFDLVELDVETDRIRLLAFSDTLANGLWNTDRWRVAVAGPESETGVPHYALGLRAFQDQGLQLTFPRGGTNLVIYADPPVHDKYGVDPALNYESDAILVAAEHRRKLHGDFDIKVEFSDLQFAMHRNNSGCHVKLAVSTQPWGMASTYGASFGRRARSLSPGAGGGYDLYYFQRSPSSAGSTSTSDAAGKFRLRREGTTMYAYYWDSSEDEWVQMGDVAYGISTEDLYVSLVMEDGAAVTSVRYTLFGHTDEETPDYPRIGTFVSSVMDAQREVTWGSLRWDEDLPSDTDVEFQVAVSDSPDGPFEFVGPNGHWSTRFSTAAGEALPTLVGRYLRYKVFLHSFDGVSSPAVSNVQISFSGLQPSSVTTYAYDPAGNRTRKTVETDDGVILDEVLDDEGWAPEDRINTLNQMMRRDVTDSGGTVSWAFTWDEDGNLTSKTDGTNTWTYTWNEDNRLVRVEGPGGVDVAFEYDAMGRMLRRSSGSDETMFEWDGWNVARETSTNGNVTRYFCLRGELLRFQRGNDFYSVHSDALGSVRIITDAAGRVVSEFGYGAFGEMLETSFDGVPGSFRYVFVGVLGCRTDETGLIFMRNRWYDPTFGRFVSRDPRGIMGTANLYSYVRSQPIGATDPLGLDTSVCAVYSETQATLKYHMDVLILDDKRRLAVRFSFGPSKPPGSKTNPLSAEPFGKLVGKRVPVPYEAALSLDPLEGKYMNLPYPVTVFADEDMTFDQIDQTLSAELGLINQKGFPYVPLGTNSNAAARTLLHALGLFDIPGPCGSGESAPGLWDLFR